MTRGSGPELLVDTSVAVALSTLDHEGRAAVLAIVDGRRIGLAGHAAFETFSVLTRLPGPARRTPAAVARIIAGQWSDSKIRSIRLDIDRTLTQAEALPQCPWNHQSSGTVDGCSHASRVPAIMSSAVGQTWADITPAR